MALHLRQPLVGLPGFKPPDDNLSLFAAAISFPRPPARPVKTLTGRKAQFNFEDSDTILSVKNQLQEKEGILKDQIRLIFSGKQMADDKTLKDYNVKAGGTIHMVLQLRG